MKAPSSILYFAERTPTLFFSFNLIHNEFEYLNSSFIKFFGADDKTITPLMILDLVHADDRQYLTSQLNSCLDGEDIEAIECRVKIGEQEKWLSINCYLFLEGDLKIITGLAEDITVNKTHETVLQEHGNRKNSILNILAHDLAGPIGNIQAMAQILLRQTAHLQDNNINEHIQLIQRVSKNANKLIRDFLTREFLESSAVNLKKSRVDLVEKMKTVTEQYLDTQKDLNIQFICNANKRMIFVEIDEDKFLQVINNLISNSLKFTPDGGTITINVEEVDESTIISVADTGVGIPQEYHATLFDKFTNARRTGLKGQRSTGLGMSIIKTIVEWHNGKIWFKSSEQEGTTFYIQLPKSE
jgi:two-component system sensor histidine kinase VicK